MYHLTSSFIGGRSAAVQEKRWQYTIEVVASVDARLPYFWQDSEAGDLYELMQPMEKMLAHMGSIGWELCGIVPTQGPALFVFKKRLPDENR